MAVVIVLGLGFSGVGDEPKATSKLAALGFLVGKWRANLPPKPDGQTVAIEARFEWAGNHQAIRFDSTWFIGGKQQPYVSGMYVWDPGKHRLMITYADADGALTTGSVETVGGAFQHELREVEADGSADQVRTRLAHPDQNTFVNEIFLMNQDQWQKLAEVKYIRME